MIKWISSNDTESLEIYKPNVSVFTETHFNPLRIIRDLAPIKIGWIVESRAIRPFAYLASMVALPFLDVILTHDRRLLKWSNKFHLVHVGSSRASDSDLTAWHKKEALVSIIASSKKATSGHRLRHQAVKELGSKMHVWGSGYRPFQEKSAALAPYRYSVAIMNARYPSYFTEILIDCFIYKTIPIFWGDPTVVDEFDSRGMHTFTTMKDLRLILSSISEQDYNERLKYVELNFNLARSRFLSTDDLVASRINALLHGSAPGSP